MPQLNLKEERLKGNELFKKHNFILALEIYKKLVDEGEHQLNREENNEEKSELQRELSLLYFNMSVTFYRLNDLKKQLLLLIKQFLWIYVKDLKERKHSIY